MNLNSVLFPAPKSSYTLELLSGKLIWIPKYKKKTNEVSHSRTGTVRNMSRSSSFVSYNSSLFKNKQKISVANHNQKLDIKDIDDEENFSATPRIENELIIRQQSTPIFLTFSKHQRKTIGEDDHHLPLRGLKLDIIEPEQSQIQIVSNDDEDAIIADEASEQPSLSNTMLYLNKQLPRNTITSISKKLSMYNLEERLDGDSSDECNKSQTSFDPRHIDEYHGPQQRLPRNMIRYPTRKFSNPIADPKQFTLKIECGSQNPSLSLLKKKLNSTMTFQSPRLEVDSSHTTSSYSTKYKTIYNDSPEVSLDLPKQKPTQSSSTQSPFSIERHIPCMLLVPAINSDKILIYFHGNSEDVYLAQDLLIYLRNSLIVNVLAMEYPGYGLYEGSPDEKTIMEDAEAVYDYLTTKLKIKPKNILLYGRSIGSGPAAYLASQKEVGALILMSAFTSIRGAAKDVAGKWAQYFIKERFNNLEAISKVKCPTFFIHGQQDKLIPYNHSSDLHNVCGSTSELLLPKGMDHADFDFYEDFTSPLIRFLQRCEVISEEKCLNKIGFPKTLFDPPQSFLKFYDKKKDALKKRHLGIQQRYSFDLSRLSSKSPKRTLFE